MKSTYENRQMQVESFLEARKAYKFDKRIKQEARTNKFVLFLHQKSNLKGAKIVLKCSYVKKFMLSPNH